MLQLQDLFAFGIGCDLGGAILLALGLLRSPAAIWRRSTFDGLFPGGLVDDVDDHVRATLGVRALIGGFGIQAVAYSLAVVLHESQGTSVSRAVIVAASAVVPTVLLLVAERITHERRFRATLLCAVRCRDGDRAEVLAKVAEHRGALRQPDESDSSLSRRVFGTDLSG